jgi:F0F1-type ATP synthase membrane subunit b/b'
MIEINLSLVFVMLCFWVTLWLVHRYLIGPVGGVIEERRRRIDGAQQEWTAKNEEHLAAIARVEEAMTAAAQEAAGVRSDARQQAMDARQQTLDAARHRADERLLAALESLDREADAARNELRRRAEELAQMLAGRVLGREVRG